MNVINLAATIVAAALALGPAAPAPAPKAADAGTFAVEFRTGPKWAADKAAGEQDGFAGHSRNLQALRREGRVVLGGRYGDRGLLVVTGASVEDVRGLFASDPSVAAGTFVFDVWEFRAFYPGCVGEKAP